MSGSSTLQSVTKDASEHLELLRRVTEQMTVHRKLEDVLSATTRGLLASADAALVRIWLFTTEDACSFCSGRRPSPAVPGEAPSLHLFASAGVFDDLGQPHHCVALGTSLGGRVAETREPLLRNDLSSERRVKSLSWIDEHGLRAYAGYPLLFRGRLEGVLGLFRRRPFTVDEFRVFSIFAAQAAIAIKTASLIEEVESRSERLSLENAYLKGEIERDRGSSEIVGQSPALLSVLDGIERVASTDTTVLLLGETGTGKELLARAIHGRSKRSGRPLVEVNCGAISPGLVESELFGHEKGAFTGAVRQKLGRFELAQGGTLFLDEVGELPADVQVKLLRVLQEREFERVGGATPIRADARVVAATNRDLEADVQAGKFRADLFYRLSVFPVKVPPLRERAEDIPSLVTYFLAQFARKLKKPLRSVDSASFDWLRQYSWPGNIRELQNVLERACVLAQGEVVSVIDHLPSNEGIPERGEGRSLREVERRYIAQVLESTEGVIQGPRGAAQILGLHPNTLRSRMERLGLTRRNRSDKM